MLPNKLESLLSPDAAVVKSEVVCLNVMLLYPDKVGDRVNACVLPAAEASMVMDCMVLDHWAYRVTAAVMVNIEPALYEVPVPFAAVFQPVKV